MNSSIVPVGDPAGEEEDHGQEDDDDTQLSIASHSLAHGPLAYQPCPSNA
jgi:hypothetical protein